VNLSENLEAVKLELQIAPLIDVVFLMLIYFMVTASLVKQEGDISFALPADVPPTTIITVPVEVRIEIDADGTIVLEGMQFPANDIVLNDLVQQVRGLKQIAESQKSPFFVNLIPNRDALHKRVINVMDACAAADVNILTFSKSM
jgi:biopolymer transport protein ExbD